MPSYYAILSSRLPFFLRKKEGLGLEERSHGRYNNRCAYLPVDLERHDTLGWPLEQATYGNCMINTDDSLMRVIAIECSTLRAGLSPKFLATFLLPKEEVGLPASSTF
jgi:hypothetical protein